MWRDAGQVPLQDGSRDPAPLETLGEPLRFLRVLWGLDHALRSRSKRMQRELGLTGPQRLAVRIVGCFPGIAPSDLARVLCVDRGTLTGIVERLVSKELVVRQPAEHDKRRVCLTLSAAGRRYNREQSGTVEAAAQQVLRTCSSAQVAGTIALIEALITELGRNGGV